MTPEEELLEPGHSSTMEENGLFPTEQQMETIQASTEAAVASIPRVRWGGFLRRSAAFIIDLMVVLALSIVMCFLSYIGYKVGLSAHGHAVTWERATPLVVLLTGGGIGLATGYFMLFHGMGGKTIGKWLLGLRVVGAEQRAITYRQALLRWLGTVGFAPTVLGFLWIIWSREKRGWHDFLARTWVIRD